MKRSLKLITLVGSALLASTVLFTSCANSSGGGSSDAKSEPTQPAAAPSAPSGTSGTSGTSGGGSSGGGGNENTLPMPDPAMLSIPLTIEAKNPCTVTINNPWVGKLKYKKNDDAPVPIPSGLSFYTVHLAADDKLEFTVETDGSGNADTGGAYTGNLNINCTDDCYVYGNVMSLLSTNFSNATTITTDWALSYLFSDNTHLYNHQDKTIVLPATTLSDNCYNRMFQGCSNITKTPVLPATELKNNCYELMFFNCSSLTEATVLRAAVLKEDCYRDMFNGCSSLANAPEIRATTFAPHSCSTMFYGCTALTEVTFPVATLAQSCCSNMFQGCTALTEVTLPDATLAQQCYEYMFRDCTELTKATILSTTLADGCCNMMFLGCSKLNYVKCLAENGITFANTYSWLQSVASSGTFIKASGATGWAVNSPDGIPNGWNVEEATNTSA